jgi:hypothetical protein
MLPVEKASQSDAQALLPAIEATLEKDLVPEQVQADSLYGSDDNCQQAKQLGVEVISPTMGTEKKDTCNLSDFQFLSNGHLDRCPAGHQPIVRKKKKNRFSQGFDCELCGSCSLSENCPAKKVPSSSMCDTRKRRCVLPNAASMSRPKSFGKNTDGVQGSRPP